MDGLGLSTLHKAVLGLLHLNLKEILHKKEYYAQVNCQDSWGKTPLHLAAARANRDDMEALLLAGADAAVTDCNNESPLVEAVRSGNIECVRLLLAMKANIHVTNTLNTQPNRVASQRSVPMADLLVQAGASLEHHTATRCLDEAAQDNSVKVVQYLLDLGVQTNVPNWAGHTPVFAAIVSHSHEVLELLLQTGVDLSYQNKNGGTVLHCLARFGVRRTAEVMLAAELNDLDPFVQDMQGQGARDVLRTRINPPEDLDAAFEELITRLENERRCGSGSNPNMNSDSDSDSDTDSDSDSEDFFDASEVLPAAVEQR